MKISYLINSILCTHRAAEVRLGKTIRSPFGSQRIGDLCPVSQWEKYLLIGEFVLLGREWIYFNEMVVFGLNER